MSRYTDIDKLIAEYGRIHIGPAGGARKLMVEAPIADVAPRAEVAREIFEEIEKIRLKEIHKCETLREKESDPSERKYWEGGEHSLRQLSYWIAELKKKYTEGQK